MPRESWSITGVPKASTPRVMEQDEESLGLVG